MRHLRRLSSTRLLALSAAAIAVLVLGVAIASAIANNGSPPRATTLPRAVHGALTAPAPLGITARIKFTSRLVNSSLMGERTSPLLKGGSGRLWVAQGGRLRLELQSDHGDSQVVSDGHRFLLSDPSSHTVYTGAVPPRHERHAHKEGKPSLAEVTKGLSRLERFATVSGPGREVVAGQPAYSVRVEPKNNKGRFGGVGAAWDATHGVPLRISIYARGVSEPVIELSATDVSYGPVPASTFKVSAPKGTKVQHVTAPRRSRVHRGRAHDKPVTGLAAVGAKLPFKLSAPETLAGERRTEVHLVASHRSPTAVISYGKPILGGMVVLEHALGKKTEGKHSSTQLPHVKIGGIDATEVSTPLGTFVSFERRGVRYTIVGPVDKAKAEAAVQGL